MTDEIRTLLRARSFVPFTIRVSDGREFFIPTRDHAHVHPGSKVVSVYTRDGVRLGVSASLLVGVTPAEPILDLDV